MLIITIKISKNDRMENIKLIVQITLKHIDSGRDINSLEEAKEYIKRNYGR